MQLVLERGSIDKPLTCDVGFNFDTTQFHTSLFTTYIIHATFQSNCAESLHFSAFHLYYGYAHVKQDADMELELSCIAKNS